MWFSRGELLRLAHTYGAAKPDYYLDDYATHLTIDPGDVAAVLELGVHQGGSLLMWRELFPGAQIFGVDEHAIAVDESLSRVHVLQADQTDSAAIGGFLQARGVRQLDIIIDDCSHLGFPTKESFAYLFETFLRPGGFYIIEDWGTGYRPTWSDGAELVEPDHSQEPAGIFRSHAQGIPGFIKQVIDCRRLYHYVVVTNSFVLVRKLTPEQLAEMDAAAVAWAPSLQ